MIPGTALQPWHPHDRPRSRRLARGATAALLAGLLVAASAAGTGAIAPAATPESQEYLDDARKRLEGGDANAAVIQLRNALQADPQNWGARRLLGSLYLAAGEFEAAEKEFERVVEANPDAADVALLLARARFRQGEYEQALATLPVAPADDQVAYGARLLRAEAQLALGRADEAAETVEELRAERLADARVSMMAARTALAQGRATEAERFAREATETEPEAAATWMVRAQVALRQGRADEAAEFAARAQDLEPGDMRASLLLAEVNLRRGRLDEAEATLKALREMAPEAVQPRYLQAALLTAREDYAGAERILDQIGDPLRDYRPAQYLTALVKYQVGRYAQARTLIERYLSEDPGNLTAQRLLAATLLRSDSPGQAAEVLTQALQGVPADVATLRLLATAQMRAGNFTDATETLRRLAESAQGQAAAQARSLVDLLEVAPEAVQVEGEGFASDIAVILNDLQVGELEASEEGARALVEDYPDNPVAHNTLAGVLLVTGQDEAARAQLEQALEIDGSFHAAYQNLDRLDVRAGDFAAIEQRYQRFLEQHPDDPWGVLRYAELLAAQDRIEEARELVERALEAHPQRRELLVAATNLALRGDDREAAAANARRIAERLPEDGRAQMLAGQAMLSLERFEQAAGYFERSHALAGDGGGTRPLELLIQARLQADDLAGAERAASELVEAHPGAMRANRLLIDLYLNAGKEAEVQELLTRASETDAELGARLQAHVALREGRPEEAAEVLEQVDEPSAATVEDRFAARVEAGDRERARARLRDWVTAHPREPGPALLLANELIRDGRHAEAETILTEALPAAGQNPVLLNNLAWLRDEMGRPGAEELARRALGMAPDSPDVADTLGWILVRRGALEEGQALLRQAADNAPDNPGVAYRLAYALAEGGQSADAIAILEEITEEDEAEFAQAEEARQLLGELRETARN